MSLHYTRYAVPEFLARHIESMDPSGLKGDQLDAYHAATRFFGEPMQIVSERYKRVGCDLPAPWCDVWVGYVIDMAPVPRQSW